MRHAARLVVAGVLLVLVTTSGSGASAQEPSPIGPGVVDRALRSVGKVTSSGTGSGWIAAPDTVITNLHVARTQLTYFTPPGEEPIECYVAAAIRAGDIAALKCPTGDRPVLSRRGAAARVGEPVLMIGYPGGEGPSATQGEVASTEVEIRGIPTVGVTAAGAPGSSGSPIMDGDGRVIAVATFGGADGIHGFEVREVQELLDGAGYLPATKAGAEWRLRLIRSLAAGLVAAALGAFLQWRSGYPGIAGRATRYAIVAIVVALAATQVQLFMDGPVHFV